VAVLAAAQQSPAAVDLLIKAYVVKGRHQIASATEKIDAGSSNQLLLKVRSSSSSPAALLQDITILLTHCSM